MFEKMEKLSKVPVKKKFNKKYKNIFEKKKQTRINYVK